MTTLGRYLVFAYNRHQAKGGWGDFIAHKDDEAEAVVFARSMCGDYDEVDVIDAHTGLSCLPEMAARDALAALRAAQMMRLTQKGPPPPEGSGVA